MIQQIGQVMLYVNDQQQVLNFWVDQIGFVSKESYDDGQIRWYEIAPTMDAETSFVLHDKQLIAKMQPELNLATPSILLYADAIDALYEQFKAKGITVGELVNMPMGRVFNFADPENNYFAIVEKG
ncbi:VOC family protein [Solibacillus sp. FSL H8-0538]|uniref:VOC family protein n=1 Tax=Solibacillus sp. FSL H8-0538 TaxID=2921400 RepID=UPI0030FB49A8